MAKRKRVAVSASKRPKKAPKKIAAKEAQTVMPRRLPGRAAIERQIDQRIRAHRVTVSATKTTKLTKGKRPLNLIAHGDSWFDYPVGDDTHGRTDITVWLREIIKPRPDILRIAHFGDAMSDLLGAKKRERLRKALRAGPTDAILFSGGGNDLVGEQFRLWLRDAASVGGDPMKAIDEVTFKGILSVVTTAYRDLVATRNEFDSNIPIFVHAYDFAWPTDIGVCGGLVGPWLFPSLESRGWMTKPKGADLQKGADIVKRMLKRFRTLLKDELEAKFANVVVVETQDTLKTRGEWHNETHPRPDGFKKLAQCFANALKTRFPNNVT